MDEQPAPIEPRAELPEHGPVQYCPHCGESVGSYWGRRGEDGSHWCESCQHFFRVLIDD